jgi:hypothetical protein
MGTLRRPTVLVALGLCLLAACSALVWAVTEPADDWLPNVATTALGIAVTITVIESIIRREASARLRPRTERVLYWLGLDLRMFTWSLIGDYTETHLHTFHPIPGDLFDLIDRWKSDPEDTPREPHEWRGQQAPLIIQEAVDFAHKVAATRERDLDVLEPDLVREIDDFGYAAAQAAQLSALARGTNTDLADTHRVGAELIVDHFDRLARAYFRGGPAHWREILDITRSGFQEHHEYMLANAERAESRPPTDA